MKDIMRKFRKKKVVITGGAGFLGSHLAERLIEMESDVTIVDIKPKEEIDGVTLGCVQYESLDVRSGNFLAYLREIDVDFIFHLAANSSVENSISDPVTDYDINLNAVFLTLEALRSKGSSAPVVIYASSAAVYGDMTGAILHENSVCLPVSPYGVSKLASERYMAVYSQIYGIKGASIRYFSLFGPRQYRNVVFEIISQLHDNPNMLVIKGSGNEVRDFNYVENAVDATLLVAARGKLSGETYNVAFGKSYTIREIANIITRLMNIAPQVVFLRTPQIGKPRQWIADISKICSLGYRPKIGVEEGLLRTIKWYRE